MTLTEVLERAVDTKHDDATKVILLAASLSKAIEWIHDVDNSIPIDLILDYLSTKDTQKHTSFKGAQVIGLPKRTI